MSTYVPELFMGKWLFVTEDERMGLCPSDSLSGDLIVALSGARVHVHSLPNGLTR